MLKFWLAPLAVCVALALPAPVRTCPACSEAIAASSEGEDTDGSNFPRAMNQSIYLMVSMPYLTLAVVGFFIYRGCQKNAEWRMANGE
jgi:hypothetical protein